jgi:hypothetical protein
VLNGSAVIVVKREICMEHVELCFWIVYMSVNKERIIKMLYNEVCR